MTTTSRQVYLSIASMNCRGLGSFEKRRDVLHFLREKKYSIYCLQDVHFENNIEDQVKSEWGLDCYFSSKSNARGVAIFINNDFEYKICEIKHDKNGNYLALDIHIQDYKITLVNIYGPNNDTPDFFEEVENIVTHFDNPHVIICGDWNLVMNEKLDCYNYVRVNNPKARERVLQMCNELHLSDPWRIQNPDVQKFTWRQHDSNKQSRLDFFLVSSELNSNVVSCEINPGYRTDHSLIDMKLDLSKIERGKGYWKFNNSLLGDKEYIDLVNETIWNVVEQYAVTPYNFNNIKSMHPKDIQFTINDQLFFEMLLMEIRSKTISYSARKKRASNEKEIKLEKEIKYIFDRISQGDHMLNQLLKEKENELKDVRKDKMEGVLVRSKTRWMEDGEKPSKYFLNMEKRNFVNKTINNIVRECDNSVLKDSQKILSETRDFYKNLYAEREIDETVDINEIFNQAGVKGLTNKLRDDIEGPITHEELKKVLKNSKNGKSPGSDGFGYEFYKMFFKNLSWFLLRSINYAYENGTLSVTQRYGIITLLPKGDKPRQFLKNWRPISLLNVSYKLASACIAERIKSCLCYIINENQKGFITGRYIGENIRLMYDLMFLTETMNIPGMLLLIDFEKAFDSVSHTFLKKILKNFNFGPSIQKWVQLFYNQASSSVLVNGFLSESFTVQRGCRQGDSLSPYLFLLCAEVLGLMIRNNKNIKGISIDNVEYKLSQYADDTVLFLDGSEESMSTAFHTLDIFANVSGLKVNIEKTQAVWIGSKNNCMDKICNDINIKWVENTETFKTLGINFSVNLEDMVHVNYDEVMTSIRNLIYNWSRRNITVLGRITIVKTLILSKLTYLILTLPDPSQQFIKNLIQMLYDFIWKGVDKVARNEMIQDYSSGGLRMVDVQSYIYALKATWIRRILKTEGTSQWINLFYKVTKVNHILNIEGGSLDILNLIQILERFSAFAVTGL